MQWCFAAGVQISHSSEAEVVFAVGMPEWPIVAFLFALAALGPCERQHRLFPLYTTVSTLIKHRHFRKSDSQVVKAMSKKAKVQSSQQKNNFLLFPSPLRLDFIHAFTHLPPGAFAAPLAFSVQSFVAEKSRWPAQAVPPQPARWPDCHAGPADGN